MRVTLVVSGLAFGLAFGTPAHAQLPKEGTYAITDTYSGTFKSVAMGEERSHLTYELLGVSLSDSGDGLLHASSVRCLGATHAIKGAYDDSGFCVYIRPDGDRAFGTYRGSGKFGAGSTGTFTFVGGTGKLAGITGGGEYTAASLRSTSAENFHGYLKAKGNYKLP